MFFQLPNGKTLTLTIEQVLLLTDENVRDMVANGNFGDEIPNAFHRSVIYSSTNLTADPDDVLGPDDVVFLDDLPEADVAELASIAGLHTLNFDGDYFLLDD